MEHLLEAHRCATDPRARALAITLLGTSMLADRDERRQIVAMAESALPEVEPLDADLALRLRALLALEGRVDDPPQLAGATAAEASFLGHLVFARMLPDASAAEIADIAQRASRQLDALLEEGTTWLGLTGMTMGFVWTDRLADAERIADSVIARARRRGSITDFANAMTMRANVQRRAGRLRDAEADAASRWRPTWIERAVRSGAASRRSHARSSTRAAPTRPRTSRGRCVGEDIPDGPPMIPVLLARDVGARRPPGIRRRRSRMGGGVAPSAARHERRFIEDYAVAADVSAARRQGARAAPRRGAVAARGQRGARRARAARRCRAARVGAETTAIEMLRRAVELLEGEPGAASGGPGAGHLGAALRRSGPPRRQPGTPPRGLRVRTPAARTGLADPARSELRASGIRLRREMATGADALTPSESADRRAGRRGTLQPGDRTGALPDRQNDRDAPDPVLPQARRRRPGRARDGAPG